MELCTYTRAELTKIFETNRTDVIRRSLQRSGYSFESSGRGDDYKIKITALPKPPSEFEEFVIREFGCGKQTNFQIMQYHFYYLFCDPDYQYLPATSQAMFLKEHCNVQISSQSLINWQRLLTSRNWLAEDRDKVRYYICRKGEYPKEITQQEYRTIWTEFFQRVEAGEDAQELRIDIYGKHGGMPRRKYGLTGNAIEQAKLDKLYDILLEFGQSSTFNNSETTKA